VTFKECETKCSRLHTTVKQYGVLPDRGRGGPCGDDGAIGGMNECMPRESQCPEETYPIAALSTTNPTCLETDAEVGSRRLTNSATVRLNEELAVFYGKRDNFPNFGNYFLERFLYRNLQIKILVL
jgi:hypothetical protein